MIQFTFSKRYSISVEKYKQTKAKETARRVAMVVCTLGCLLFLILGFLLERGNFNSLTIIAVYACCYFFGGFYSFRSALASLFERKVNIDLLMVVAAIGAACVKEYPEGGILLFLFSLSGTLEQFILGRTRQAIEALMEIVPERACLIKGEKELIVGVEELKVGDVVRVRPGEKIPADGKVISGSSSVNQAALTGESMPVDKTTNDMVLAGSLNIQGALEVRVTVQANDSTLARVINRVEEAQSEKAVSQKFSEWFGERYTLGVLGFAAIVFTIFLLKNDQTASSAFYHAITILVVASPCAVVLSIPSAILSAVAAAAKRGVLLKGGTYLETAAEIRTIAFDKTGTLTLGAPKLDKLLTPNQISEEFLLTIAASAESLSEHPLARAIISAAREKNINLLDATNLTAEIGQGVSVDVSGKKTLIGKSSLLERNGIFVEQDFIKLADQLREQGSTVVFVSYDTQFIGAIAVADALRASALPALSDLQNLGISKQLILTGDHRGVAAAISKTLGIEYLSELMPEGKLETIKKLQQENGPVAMVGDGINDAPSLAVADLGISLGTSGTAVALETADVVLMKDDLSGIPYLISLARASKKVVKQNLLISFGVMLVLLFFSFFGTMRLPLAVAAHEGSTVVVILNGLRLLAFNRK